ADVAIACPNSVIHLIPWQNPPVGIPLQLMDDKKAVSVFTTESAATQISIDDYAFPVDTEYAQNSDHRVPPETRKSSSPALLDAQPLLDGCPRGQNRLLYSHSPTPLYMMLII